jgi:hypothetical protein
MDRDDGRRNAYAGLDRPTMTAKSAMSRKDADETDAEDDHLAGIEDGAGCTEIWEHLSRGRRAEEEARSAASDDN